MEALITFSLFVTVVGLMFGQPTRISTSIVSNRPSALDMAVMRFERDGFVSENCV